MFRISDFATNDNYTDSFLLIMKINYDLYGEYICKASNYLGTAEIAITVYGKYCFYTHLHKILCFTI